MKISRKARQVKVMVERLSSDDTNFQTEKLPCKPSEIFIAIAHGACEDFYSAKPSTVFDKRWSVASPFHSGESVLERASNKLEKQLLTSDSM